MRGKDRKSIASCIKLPQFTTMNVIDGQADFIFYSSLIFYSLTINNILNIIVLLILSGVAIATLTGDNGLLQKAGKTKNTSEKAGEKERIQVEVTGAYDLTGKLEASQVENNIKNNIKDANVTATTKEDTEEKYFPVKVEYNNGHKYGVLEDGKIIENLIVAGETAPSDSNATYCSGNYTAVIPSGFTVSDVDGEDSIETGLVIRDENGNEFVWIPVGIPWKTDNSKNIELGRYTFNTNGDIDVIKKDGSSIFFGFPWG